MEIQHKYTVETNPEIYQENTLGE